MNKLYVAGIGFPSIMTDLSLKTILASELIVGYKKYVEEIKHFLTPTQETFCTGMRQEVDRVTYAVNEALKGRKVCLVCSGDPSLYGMAALAHELAEGKDVEIEVIPSVTAATAASARLGAPVAEDLAILSLSDQLLPWEIILKRIDAVNMGDFVCAIYNPRSKTRQMQLPYTIERFRQARGNLITGVVTNAFRIGEQITITTLDDLDIEMVDMFTMVIVGNTCTRIVDGKMITPRGYKL